MKLIFTLAFLFPFSLLSAQDISTVNSLEKLVKLDISLRGVGITYEPKLGNKMTIELSGGIGGGYDISFNDFNYTWNFLDPALYVIAYPKYYYNRSKRQAKNKTTALNSGNYIGLGIKYTSRGIAESTEVWDAFLFNLHWGMQRAIGKRWTFNTHAGVGYAIDASDLSSSSGTVYPALDLRFAYILNKKRM